MKSILEKRLIIILIITTLIVGLIAAKQYYKARQTESNNIITRYEESRKETHLSYQYELSYQLSEILRSSIFPIPVEDKCLVCYVNKDICGACNKRLAYDLIHLQEDSRVRVIVVSNYEDKNSFELDLKLPPNDLEYYSTQKIEGFNIEVEFSFVFILDAMGTIGCLYIPELYPSINEKFIFNIVPRIIQETNEPANDQ
ncbi:MAG: hypothetical protein K9J25_12890 [Bacteroidales bacterium]|nr:hypothetical protein [Bacteroidales bacterium]